MFTIVISEKGGGERRETFDKSEINVGRVQGNDLMLPKGNVSKHHARLLLRDGRFIVTDLKSTNGTYVNGRKIGQATIVREGDKIYVGDFVLRVESNPDAPTPYAPEPGFDAAGRGDMAPPPNDNTENLVGDLPGGGARGSEGRLPSQAPVQAQPSPEAGGYPIGRIPPAPRIPTVAGAVAPPPATNGHGSGGQQGYAAASAPPVVHSRGSMPGAGGPAYPLHTPVVPVAPVAPAAVPSANPVVVRHGGDQPSGRPAESMRAPVSMTGGAPLPFRTALMALASRVERSVEISALGTEVYLSDSVVSGASRVIREQAQALRREGVIPETLDLEALIGVVAAEFLGTGPLGAILVDENVVGVQCARFDRLRIVRRDGSTVDAPNGFSSEESLTRAITRLAREAGHPLAAGEMLVDRILPSGDRFTATLPPLSMTPTLEWRRRRRVESTLAELLRLGNISSPIAVFLESCVNARANVLVTGPSTEHVTTLLSALAALVPATERLVLVEERDEIAVSQPNVLRFPMGDRQDGGRLALQAAARFMPNRLVVAQAGWGAAYGIVEAIASGCSGVLAGAVAPSLRQGLARFISQVALSQKGLGSDAAREAVGEGFDLAVEVVAGSEDKARVVRVTELVGGESAKNLVTRDIFSMPSTGMQEGSHPVPTGVIPRIVTELGLRGQRLDLSIFKRPLDRTL